MDFQSDADCVVDESALAEEQDVKARIMQIWPVILKILIVINSIRKGIIFHDHAVPLG
jgi:hypothetical protein